MIKRVVAVALTLHLLFLVPKFLSTMTKSSFWVLFFFVNLLFVAIWMRGLKSSIQDCDSFSYLPPFVEEAEYQLPVEFHDEDFVIHDDNDFLPGLVHVEYKKEEPLLLVHSDDDGEGDGFHGYDGYEEDGDDSGGDSDDGSSEDEGEEVLKRFEEFIAKQKGNWREELLDEEFLCIIAGT